MPFPQFLSVASVDDLPSLYILQRTVYTIKKRKLFTWRLQNHYNTCVYHFKDNGTWNETFQRFSLHYKYAVTVNMDIIKYNPFVRWQTWLIIFMLLKLTSESVDITADFYTDILLKSFRWLVKGFSTVRTWQTVMWALLFVNASLMNVHLHVLNKPLQWFYSLIQSASPTSVNAASVDSALPWNSLKWKGLKLTPLFELQYKLVHSHYGGSKEKR